VSGNTLKILSGQHFCFTATLEVRTAHLQARHLQLHVGNVVSASDRLIIQRTALLLQLIDATLTKDMTTFKT
jgi:hypothetical protein